MTSFILVVSVLLVIGALGVLVRTIIRLVAEVNLTTCTGAESIERIKGAVTGIQEEERLLRGDLTLLTGAAAAWPRAAVLPREAGLLVRNIRSLGAATALLSTLRRAAW
jgi:hypothetical protein